MSVFYSDPNGHRNIIFHQVLQPVSDIDGRVCSDGKPPDGQAVIFTSGLNDVSAEPISWSVGDFTGFFPTGDLKQFQRGVSEAYGTSAVQFQGGTAGMYVNTRSSTSSDRLRAALVLYQWAEELFPWRYGEEVNLCVSHYAAVPVSSTEGGTLNYTYTAIMLLDVTTNKIIWVSVNHYESRGESQFIEVPIWWAEMDSPISISHFGGYRYCTLLPTSHCSSAQPWSDWRYFGFAISRFQLKTIVNEINAGFQLNLSDNPDHYQLRLLAIGPEIATDNGTDGCLAMRVKDISVFTLTENWNVDEKVQTLQHELASLRDHLKQVHNGRVMRVLRAVQRLFPKSFQNG